MAKVTTISEQGDWMNQAVRKRGTLTRNSCSSATMRIRSNTMLRRPKPTMNRAIPAMFQCRGRRLQLRIHPVCGDGHQRTVAQQVVKQDLGG